MLMPLLLVAAILLVGYLELTVFKLRASACMTWILGLAVLVAWIVSPGTTIFIVAGVVVAVLGLISLFAYFVGSKERVKLD